MSDNLEGATVLGRYAVRKRLGAGGMGEVYLGMLTGVAGFAKTLVIKRMLSGVAMQADAKAMFEREARILSLMKHPSIVGVVDFGIEPDGSYLMVMDHVDGVDLHHWLHHFVGQRGPLPVQAALQIIIDVLEALDYAHTLRDVKGDNLGIMHRDVSPSNILVDRAGRVVLIDFGIARSAYDPVRTAAGQYKGKFSYMAPELITGSAPADASSDVYACAVVLYEILSGRNPFRVAEPQGTVARVLTLVPDRLDTLRGDVAPGLAAALAKALAKDASERYRSARALRDALIVFRTADSETIRDSLRDWVREDIEVISPLDAEFRESSARLAASGHETFSGARPTGGSSAPATQRIGSPSNGPATQRKPQTPSADPAFGDLEISFPAGQASVQPIAKAPESGGRLAPSGPRTSLPGKPGLTPATLANSGTQKSLANATQHTRAGAGGLLGFDEGGGDAKLELAYSPNEERKRQSNAGRPQGGAVAGYTTTYGGRKSMEMSIGMPGAPQPETLSWVLMLFSFIGFVFIAASAALAMRTLL